ncbi:plant intracellular Ras-group-related LRR protein 6-like isoform X1 [Macadamia integrifolia]|uniref:plant intracellular Ras-group-related LRR protein 6-like isoform X1 n=2 Tax=Macadamia integrifolia TaxID=60698 RepID=UPI001C4F6984|nr:plant intracellular Ras-group-related LRR protein 6-like isoform X1 [Macadamia integrifolia]
MMYYWQQVRMDVRKAERSRSMKEDHQKLENVDLSGLSLDSLPNSPLNLAIICTLDLSNNNLENIPESLTARLLNVVTLDVHSNQLKSLPNSIGCLSKLKILNVSGNLIESLPKSIENCRSLEELNANFNKLKRLPDTIGFELLNLKKLSVNSNKLTFLPSSISHLTSLRILDARLNCLGFLPEGMENLINLEILNVSQNFQYLDTLPYSIGLLYSLLELDISYNQITTLPESIGCLKNLKKLSVDGNPLVSPPMDIVKRGLVVVKEYLMEKMNHSPKGQVKKKRSWLGKLVRHKTFSGHMAASTENQEEIRDKFIMDHYQSIDGLTSPRHMGMFSPRRLFSPRSSCNR